MHSVPRYFFIALLVLTCPSQAKKVPNYNGEPLNRTGITITPQTSRALLSSYTQALNFAGLLDCSFAGSGIVITSVAAGTNSVHAVAVQPDGKILVAGSARVGFNQSFALARYTSTGILDTTFGTNGITTSSFGFGDDVINAITLQQDGKIVVAGSAALFGNTFFAVARYTSTGILDTSFNGNGKVTTSIEGTNNQAFAVGMQSDGKIVVAGFANASKIALARYTPTGILDTTFGTAAGTTVTTLGTGARAYALNVQSDDTLIIGGYASVGREAFALLRYSSSGILDNSFGTNGITTTIIADSDSQAFALATQPDGNLLLAGFSIVNAQDYCAIARYTSLGILDPTFGTNSITTTRIGSGAEAYAIALQSDGKPVVAGYANVDATSQFFVARYTTTGALDTTFGTQGTVTSNLTAPVAVSFNGMTLQSDGKIIVAGSSQSSFTVARYINPWTLSSLTAVYGEVGMV